MNTTNPGRLSPGPVPDGVFLGTVAEVDEGTVSEPAPSSVLCETPIWKRSGPNGRQGVVLRLPVVWKPAGDDVVRLLLSAPCPDVTRRRLFERMSIWRL
jgi:hypothetical protein